MPCEKHGPRASVTTKTSAFGLGFCLLSPSGHVFHTARETMIKSYIGAGSGLMPQAISYYMYQEQGLLRLMSVNRLFLVLLVHLVLLSHTPLCISMISGVCVQGMWNAQVKGQVNRNAQVKGQQPLWHSFVYLNVWHHNGATIATIVATIATTS